MSLSKGMIEAFPQSYQSISVVDDVSFEQIKDYLPFCPMPFYKGDRDQQERKNEGQISSLALLDREYQRKHE
jgi:hypothetical protein